MTTSTEEIKESGKAKIARKIIDSVLLEHKLEVKDIEISPDGKFLISCSECVEDEDPYLIVWNIEELLEGENKPEVRLLGQRKENKFTKLTNWLLCLDSSVVEIGGRTLWVVCAGSIIGDIYVWSFGKSTDSDKWDFENYKTTIISVGQDPERHPKALFDIKIKEDADQSNHLRVYYALNNIYSITMDKDTKFTDNTFNEIKISIDASGVASKEGEPILIGISDVWITKIAIEKDLREDLLATGTRDGKILLWDLGKTNEPALIGEHEDSITDLALYLDGKRIASSAFDNKISLWERKYGTTYEKIQDLVGHSAPVLSIDVHDEEDNMYLMSSSKDDTIKIWDIEDDMSWTRSLDMTHFVDEFEKTMEGNEKKLRVSGMDFVRNIKITPDNRYIFVSKYNRIVILRNFGNAWHFIQQLKFVKKNDPELYRRIYGENLKQIAKFSPENLETIKKLYEITKNRLIKARTIELEGKTEQIDYNMRELGALFIPAFMKFEPKLKSQKEFMLGVKHNYEAYWHSIRNSIFKLPDIPWGFKLYITTSEMDERLEDSKFVEITGAKGDAAHIIMKDRTQTQLRFLLVLDKIKTPFIPLINNINMDVEDDRGDKDNLVFSDFTYSKNFINVLTNPKKSLEKSKKLEEPDEIYFADCTFQIDEGYCVEDYATIFIRKITVEYTETLEPSESSTSDEEDFMIFEAFRNNFLYPLTPKTRVRVGKGIGSTFGKIIDEYFAKIIIVEFILSLWGFIVEIPGLNIPDEVSTIVQISSIAIIGIIFLMMIFKMRSGKKSDLDVDDLEQSMRKRRRRGFRR